ncbi:MAG: hypothetical protein KAU17_14175 [Spirochaetales bacterium]|nr:hypothetical protein [Spirochaetales bacterium]
MHLLRKKATTFELEYEPENITILVPRNVEIDRVGEYLSQHDIVTTRISGKDFSFSETGSVRLSTLHASKGLDFPVVMMYLPYLNRKPLYDEESTEKLLRNLVYVGMTRRWTT